MHSGGLFYDEEKTHRSTDGVIVRRKHNKDNFLDQIAQLDCTYCTSLFR